MPTYEYECSKCKHRFEKLQSMSAEPITKCPKCSGKVTRLISSGAGVIFKGSGFYHTDYKTSTSKSKEKSSSPSCGKSSACEGCDKNG